MAVAILVCFMFRLTDKPKGGGMKSYALTGNSFIRQFLGLSSCIISGKGTHGEEFG